MKKNFIRRVLFKKKKKISNMTRYLKLEKKKLVQFLPVEILVQRKTLTIALNL